MEILKFPRTTLYQAHIEYVSDVTQRSVLLPLYPFLFESREDAYAFANARGTDRNLIKMERCPACVLEDGSARALDREENLLYAICAHTPFEKRQCLIREYDDETSVARRIVSDIIGEATITEDTAKAKIRRALKKANVCAPCWESVVAREPTEQELEELISFLQKSREALRRTPIGKGSPDKNFTREDARRRWTLMRKQAEERRQEESIRAAFSEEHRNAEGVQGYRFVSVEYKDGKEMYVIVKSPK